MIALLEPVLRQGDVVAGKWRIEAELGHGGMGIVYSATDVRLLRRVAVKLLRSEVAGDSDSAKRFLREARASVQLHSEHVCRVLDVGELASGAPFMVMELLEGNDLAHVIAERSLAPAVAAGYLAQACDALAEAHALGIVHRDIKPANLFLAKRPGGAPIVKVLDFGIATALPAETVDAKLTQTDVVMGSPCYMSPEQLASSHAVDARSDVWSMGVTLYQMVSGQLPFTGTMSAVSIAIATQRPPPLPGVPAALWNIIERCMAREPQDRFASAAELRAELARFTATVPGRAAIDRGAPVRASAPTAEAMQAVTVATVATAAAAPASPVAPQVDAMPSSPAAAQVDVPPTSRRTFPRRFLWLAGLGALAAGGAAWWLATRPAESRARFVSVDISRFANFPFDWFLAPPHGNVYFAGVPFTILSGPAAVVHTHTFGRPDLPQRVALPVPATSARRVHAIVLGNNLHQAKQPRVGELAVHHESGEVDRVPLIIATTLREDWMMDDELYHLQLRPPPAGVTWQNVLSEPQLRDGDAHAFLDLLTVEVRPSPIDRIELVDDDAQAGITLVSLTLECAPS